MAKFAQRLRFDWRCRAIALSVAALSPMASVQARQVIWRFDNAVRIGSHPVSIEGAPKIVPGPRGLNPRGKVLHFDGQGDSILIDGRPLIGATHFTAEVIFKPEGGAPEQRFMHIAETDPATGLDTGPNGTPDVNGRFMFEIRVVGAQWYLDTYLKSAAGGQTLAFPDKRYPLGHWYAVAQTYDGTTYRAYVNGVLQGEAAVPFVPHGPGRVRVGARMNRIDHFNGALASARFTDRALPPAQLLRVAP